MDTHNTRGITSALLAVGGKRKGLGYRPLISSLTETQSRLFSVRFYVRPWHHSSWGRPFMLKSGSPMVNFAIYNILMLLLFIFLTFNFLFDCLICLVVRVSDHRSRGCGFDSWVGLLLNFSYKIFWMATRSVADGCDSRFCLCEHVKWSVPLSWKSMAIVIRE